MREDLFCGRMYSHLCLSISLAPSQREQNRALIHLCKSFPEMPRARRNSQQPEATSFWVSQVRALPPHGYPTSASSNQTCNCPSITPPAANKAASAMCSLITSSTNTINLLRQRSSNAVRPMRSQQGWPGTTADKTECNSWALSQESCQKTGLLDLPVLILSFGLRLANKPWLPQKRSFPSHVEGPNLKTNSSLSIFGSLNCIGLATSAEPNQTGHDKKVAKPGMGILMEYTFQYSRCCSSENRRHPLLCTVALTLWVSPQRNHQMKS